MAGHDPWLENLEYAPGNHPSCTYSTGDSLPALTPALALSSMPKHLEMQQPDRQTEEALKRSNVGPRSVPEADKLPDNASQP